MDEIKYLDFDLLIERTEEGYTARVLNSPAGQATADFSLPFSDLELENFLLRVGHTRRGVRRLESPEMQAAKTFGGRLFRAVFDDEVRGCFRSSLDEASRQEAGLRVRLRLADAPELADLPWEYLYNPSLNRFLVLSAETPLVRYLDLPERIRPLAVEIPLKVMVMISSPSDYPPLDVDREWAKLKEALGDLEQRGLVTLERLEDATLTALQRRLRRVEYHIFHFIGHGGFDERAQDGVLLLEDEHGRGRTVSGQYLGTLLHDERTLRLAILNACEGARTSRSDPFAGTAQSLVQQGIPAVIAMQFEITDEAAIAMAHEFYTALADGYPVDAALAEARKAIFAQDNDVEWGTPVLYMRSPDGHIFDIERVSEEERKSVQVAVLYREAQTAMAGEDWATAIEKLQAVLALDPAHAEATARLNQARRQQELATLYAQGRAHYEAGRLREALECFRRVQDTKGDYRDVGTLIATIERAMAEEQKRDKIAALYRKAQAAMTGEDWATAIEKLQAVLALDPAHAEATARLNQARRQQELATLYAQGLAHYKAGRWHAALECLRRVQEIQGHYKDVGTLIVTVERAMTPKQSPPAPQPPPSKPRRWLWVGIPAALVLLLLICGGGYLFLSGIIGGPTPAPKPVIPEPTTTLAPEAVSTTATPVPTSVPTSVPPSVPSPTVFPASETTDMVMVLAGEPFENSAVQEAIAVGVPWAELIQNLFPDREIQITVLAQGQEFELTYYDIEYNPDVAWGLLEDTGFSGFQLWLLFISDDDASFTDIAEEIGWYLGEIGIMVDLVPVEADRVHDAMDEMISANETVLWLGWQGTVPTPPPTMATPTPYSEAAVPPSIVTQGTIQLVDGQSFDFLTGDVGSYTGGDLYVCLGGCDGPDSFWANNIPQRGGVDLGELSESDLSLIQAPTSESAYSRFDVPIEWNHVYAYLQNQQGLVVIFRVLEYEEEAVYLEYVVIEGP